MEALLKVAEAAALQGVSVRWVRKKASEGHYAGIQVRTNAQNRPEYLIPLASLPEPSQRKYIEQHRPAPAAPARTASKSPAARPLESYSGEERAEISYWLTMVDRWQQYDYTAAAQAADDLPGDAGDWELLDMDDFLPQPKPPQPSFRTIPHKTTRRSAHEPQKAKPTE